MIPFYENPKDEINVFHTSNLHFPAHLHSSIELIYVETGSMHITVNQESLEIHQGDFVIIFPNIVHSYHDTIDGDCHLIIAICRQKMAGDYLNTIQKFYPVHPIIPCRSLHPDIIYSMKALVLEPSGRDIFGTGKAFIQLILSRIFPILALNEYDTADINDITYQVIDYISNHYQEPVTLSTLAKVLCVSKYHLSRTFSKKLHLSFNEYLNNFRLDYAAAMLQTTNQSITDISLDAGFKNQSTFNRVFKKEYGISPREYRFIKNQLKHD